MSGEFVALGLSALAFALPLTAATQPRPAPGDYPVQDARPELTLAGEFYGRSAPAGKSTIFTGHYLVVEVAIFPTGGHKVDIQPSEIRLFVNGSKRGLLPQGGSLVAGTLKWYGYEHERGVGIGAGPIYIPSQPRQDPNFPGDPNERRMPRPDVPASGPDSEAGGRTSADPAEALPAMELEAGETLRPVSGYLYFYWGSSTKKLRDVELRWEPVWGAPPKAVLKLVSRH